jgi:hypothetical protein
MILFARQYFRNHQSRMRPLPKRYNCTWTIIVHRSSCYELFKQVTLTVGLQCEVICVLLITTHVFISSCMRCVSKAWCALWILPQTFVWFIRQVDFIFVYHAKFDDLSLFLILLEIVGVRANCCARIQGCMQRHHGLGILSRIYGICLNRVMTGSSEPPCHARLEPG